MKRKQPTTKLGTWGGANGIYCNWLDTDTGERGQGYFNMTRLCELGYGKLRVFDLVVNVRTVQLGVRG